MAGALGYSAHQEMLTGGPESGELQISAQNMPPWKCKGHQLPTDGGIWMTQGILSPSPAPTPQHPCPLSLPLLPPPPPRPSLSIHSFIIFYILNTYGVLDMIQLLKR